ncbi:MAG: DUF2865 domain-containing protein, partial [Hyphomicrobiales bacterium]|nr:DUF2865 domain-containing protein [Hyphomicrobiales bacterium]
MLAVAFGAPVAARAQQVDCPSLKAEIASLSAGGTGQRYLAAAQKQAQQIAQTQAYAQSIGCDNRKFLFFGSNPPAQCDGIKAKIGQMQANLGQLRSAANGGSTAALNDRMARYDLFCRGKATADTPLPAGPATGATYGPGSKAVCVRVEDGAFFPVSYTGGNGRLTALCHALCPNAQTEVFTYSLSGDITNSVSLAGKPYTSLPGAARYQKTFDPSISCRAPGQSWAQAMAASGAESLVGGHGDVIVSAARADQM